MIEREKLVDVLRNSIGYELAVINDDPDYVTKEGKKLTPETKKQLDQIMRRVDEHLKELFPE